VCDTLCVVGGDRTVFGKNSDRPVAEAQVVETYGARTAGARLRTQYLEIPDAGAIPLLGSRPTWLWGLEHGVNDHRVAIGNEKVWTVDDPHAAPPALLGMDLVRLGLERGRSADEAFEVMTALLAEHGQGGSGEHDADEPYWSSFLVADPRGAWILETSGRRWAARAVEHGASISNRVALGTGWTRASGDVASGSDLDRWLPSGMSTGHADRRLAATGACVASSVTLVSARDVVATLRHHGERAWGRPGDRADDVSPPPAEILADGTGVTVCMHIPGYQATAASMVSELPAAPDEPLRAWVALGSPCASVYLPVFPPTHVPAALARPEAWKRFHAVRDRVDADHAFLRDVRAVFAPLEAALWDEGDDAARSGDDTRRARAVADGWRAADAALTRLETG
jgi:secernin